MWRILIASILIITITSCKEKKVTYADNGKKIDIAVGQVLKIELPSDASSGNTWRKFVYNDSVIIRKGKPNYMLSSDPNSPGVYYFRFEAVAPGISKLYIEYGNKFGKEKPALKTFEIDIEIHNLKSD